jgi:hypothetical protein
MDIQLSGIVSPPAARDIDLKANDGFHVTDD